MFFFHFFSWVFSTPSICAAALCFRKSKPRKPIIFQSFPDAFGATPGIKTRMNFEFAVWHLSKSDNLKLNHPRKQTKWVPGLWVLFRISTARNICAPEYKRLAGYEDEAVRFQRIFEENLRKTYGKSAEYLKNLNIFRENPGKEHGAEFRDSPFFSSSFPNCLLFW